jgi:hypothetical protein
MAVVSSVGQSESWDLQSLTVINYLLRFATTIKNKLHLKFEMSDYLRSQFHLQNPDLEILNHQFSAASLGLRIWNYIETRDMKLGVLTSDDE